MDEHRCTTTSDRAGKGSSGAVAGLRPRLGLTAVACGLMLLAML